MYVVGGRDEKNCALQTVECFDGLTHTCVFLSFYLSVYGVCCWCHPYIYMNLCTHTHTHTHTHTCMHAYVCIYTCMHAYVSCVCVCVCVFSLCVNYISRCISSAAAETSLKGLGFRV